MEDRDKMTSYGVTSMTHGTEMTFIGFPGRIVSWVGEGGELK